MKDCAHSISQHPSCANFSLCRLLCMLRRPQEQFCKCLDFLRTELAQRRPLGHMYTALLSMPDERGITPLMATIQFLASNAVRYLLNMGADATQLSKVMTGGDASSAPGSPSLES